ncbi:hypothetical protein F511_36014 [Dorcoceras hygrometricum]|uniref:Uncharacterized protein n=1 Tax=Dorcoceras hygrometricum TaxID=472368 RepID=A0A2Z7C406_9LAMI|nr:hypothetical protein F511_36014 [Dorcoceras hygrometricum]
MQGTVARDWMSSSCASLSTVDCDDITADVIIADSRSCASCQRLILDFFQSAMLTSSLLLAASSSRHADIIIAESRFLFASIQQLISSFFALLIPDFYCSSSSSTLLQQTSYSSAGLLAPADLSSSAEHDVVTDDIIIDGPLRCSRWFPFDVPAGPSSSSSSCSWFLSFQLVHYAPAGSTWPPPDYEQLTQLWTSPLSIQLPTMTTVDGSLVIQEGNDLWKPIPGPVAPSNFEVSRQRSYVDTLPPVTISLDRSVFREATNFYSVVQRAPLLLLTDSDTQENLIVHMVIDQRPDSPSTSANSFMRFDEDDTAATQFSLPAISTDLTEAFAQLRASVEQIHFEQIRHLDGKVATVRSELLDFRAKVEENHLNLSTQLGFLVDYINRGGDTKKGEGGSSSRPQPPLDDQSKPVGEMEAEQMIRADLVEAVSVEKVEAEVVVVIKEETTEVVQREGDLIVEVVNRELNRVFVV